MEGGGAGTPLKDLVAFLAMSLVDHPESVLVEEEQIEDSTVLKLTVAREDLGRVIGRQGRTARAIRAVLSTAALKQNRRAMLEILE